MTRDSNVRTLERAVPEGIAIIGIGCRFPGAKGPDALWRLLRDGVDAITEVPADRFDIDAVYDPTSTRPGTLCSRWGGFLQHVDQFDPYFFGISPREAARMDPQQRLLLEVAWEALEDGGQVPDKLVGSRTGVFVGMCNSDYANLLVGPENIDIYFTAGVAFSVLPGRVSYALGLEGPSVAVDTACSTSLVATHLACQSLLRGESDLALAGGSNLILLPEAGIGFSQAKALSPDGRCKFGDARANGFVRSDGVAVVVLKALSRARADGDRIYAVIRGSAVNNDGRSGGLLMAPSRLGQEGALREAYRNAGVSPSRVQYVEAHGTGTSVGDPIELEALGAVVGADRPEDRPCFVGSMKTNIGHTEGAAGVAGLIKVALSLWHRAIPANLHFHEPNPHVPWRDLHLVIPRELTPWPADSRPALAGVSSFGISGTNAHIVLEEAPRGASAVDETAPSALTPHLVPLSAHTPEALRAMAHAYQAFMSVEQDAPALQDLCYTASVRRSHHDHRLAVVAHSREELTDHLEAFLQEELRPGMSSGRRIPDRRRKLVFVFPGQGSQWIGMARDLFEQEPVFRRALERCDAAMRAHTDWSLLKELAADESDSRFDELDIIQPALFAIQVGLSMLWRSWGVEPDAVLGHSMGEVAAAHVAGILELDDAVRIICRRSQVVRRRASGKGGMAVVELPAEEVKDLLAGWGGRVEIAACNGPTTTVVSGDRAALQELRASIEAQGTFFQMVKVDYASHSKQMEPLRAELLEALGGVRPRMASVPMISTVTASPLDGSTCETSYWVRNLRETVLFSQAVHHLVRDGHAIFLEISPHPVLTGAISQCLARGGYEGSVLPSLRRKEEGRAVMLGSLGELYTLGYPVDWGRLYPSEGRIVRLPSYPWQRERFWLGDHEVSDGGTSARSHGRRAGMRRRLLGPHLRSAADSGTHFWEMDVSIRSFPYLGDHRVQGLVVLPAAAYVEMALAAAAEVFGAGAHVLEGFTFTKALFLPEEGSRTVQLVLSQPMIGAARFQFFSRESIAGPEQASWVLHASGSVRLDQADLVAPAHESPETIEARCPVGAPGADAYQVMRERGLQYGPSFQGIEHVWRRDGEALGRLRLPDMAQSEAGAYQVHPALLDAGFQVLGAALARQDAQGVDGSLFLPVGLDRLRVYSRPGTRLWSHGVLRSDAGADADTLEGDVFLLNENGQVVLEALGFRLRRLERDARGATTQDLHDWLYEIQWRPRARPPGDQGLDTAPPHQPGKWLIFADGRGVADALREFLAARGDSCVIVSPGDAYAIRAPEHYQLDPRRPEEFRRLVGEVVRPEGLPCRGVIHLWTLETTAPEDTTLASLESDQQRGSFSVLHLVQGLAGLSLASPPQLWLVTAGSQAVGDGIGSVSIGQSPVWGLGKVISIEHPELRCARVDLSAASTREEIESLFRELSCGDHEDQIALRGDQRYVARLARLSLDAREERRRPAAQDERFRLEIATPGILDNLTLRAAERRAPGPGEVEIEVRAAGLIFRDVMIALGLVPPVFEGSLDLGWECAGVIARLGEDVDGFRVGDEVVGIAPSAIGSFVTTSAALVAMKPARLSFEQVVTIPVAFITAYYALHHLGRLSKGERVLIHAAAGGVGLAAVQLAQQAGAEIFATAGSPEKREFLHSLGVSHVMDSRSLAFADEVIARTGGSGVDVVLNSLAGEFIPKSLSTLAPGGRFLEIGKVDVLQNTQLALGHLDNNRSFFAIDLAQMFSSRPEFSGSMFRELMRHFDDGSFTPLPLRVFPISEAADAFRYMAQSKHIGKVVVTLQEKEVLIAPSSEPRATFRPDGTYLITGGLGGLGLTVAEWMVSRGARHLVLVGRRGASAAAAQKTLEAIKKLGASVVVAQVDVGQKEDVARILGEIRQSMPRLRGIVHAAGILDDGILLQQTAERFTSVMAPKINGAWNLHALTAKIPLDLFVLFSSGASVLGSPGQGNYVAANAFLDALAHHRRALGLPALTINWGAWAEVGLAARSDRSQHLIRQGILPFSPQQGVRLLERVLHHDLTQVMAVAIDWRTLLASFSPPLLAGLAEEVTSHATPSKTKRTTDGLTREKLLATPPDDRPRLVEAFLVEQIARVLRCSPSKVDVHQPLNKLGIDSLMAVELKNRVEADLETPVPVAALLQGPSLTQLAAHLLGQLPQVAAVAPTPLTGGETAEQLLARVDQLSDQEVDALLSEMLEGDAPEKTGRAT